MANSVTSALRYLPVPIFCALMLGLLLLNSCQDRPQADQWDIIRIDPSLPKDSSYARIHQEPEIFSRHEVPDTLRKRTSGVAYRYVHENNAVTQAAATFNNCRVALHHDTLWITIGIETGFGGSGFIIQCAGNQFTIRPYYITDVISTGEAEPRHQTIHQSLTLDKGNYHLGDSIYGAIDFTSIESKKGKKTGEHRGKGYFRTIVTKP